MTNKRIIKVANRNGKVIKEVEVTSKYAAKRQAQRMLDNYGETHRVYVEPKPMENEQ